MKKLLSVLSVGVVLGLANVVPASAAIIIDPEPPVLPTKTEQCKKGGWENYNGLFKNQGDCVSYVATGGKNLPDGPNAPGN